MTGRRAKGLTLVEVLAAISVLSLLAAAVVPWFADAVRVLRLGDERVDFSRLAAAADALAKDPVGEGIKDLAPGVAVAFAVPVGDEVEEVTVTRCPAAPDDRLGRGFFSVSAHGGSVLRWRATPDPVAGETR